MSIENKLVSKPMTLNEILKIADEDGYFCVNVHLDLDNVIDYTGIDEFLNYIEELIVADSSWLLTDVAYSVIGAHEGDIVLQVEAYVEASSSDDPEDDMGDDNEKWDPVQS